MPLMVIVRPDPKNWHAPLKVNCNVLLEILKAAKLNEANPNHASQGTSQPQGANFSQNKQQSINTTYSLTPSSYTLKHIAKTHTITFN